MHRFFHTDNLRGRTDRAALIQDLFGRKEWRGQEDTLTQNTCAGPLGKCCNRRSECHAVLEMNSNFLESLRRSSRSLSHRFRERYPFFLNDSGLFCADYYCACAITVSRCSATTTCKITENNTYQYQHRRETDGQRRHPINNARAWQRPRNIGTGGENFKIPFSHARVSRPDHVAAQQSTRIVKNIFVNCLDEELKDTAKAVRSFVRSFCLRDESEAGKVNIE